MVAILNVSTIGGFMCDRIEKTRQRLFDAVSKSEVAYKKFEDACDSGDEDEIHKWLMAFKHSDEYVEILDQRLKMLGGGQLFLG
ncbi:MAG: hypothetical protein ACRDBQ_14925 [Shewanella sp.]